MRRCRAKRADGTELGHAARRQNSTEFAVVVTPPIDCWYALFVDRTLEAQEDLGPAARKETTCLYLVVEGARPGAGGARHSLAQVDEIRLGRGPARSFKREGRALVVTVPDGLVSTQHARVVREGDAWRLEDAGSRNGVWAAAGRVKNTVLDDGDWFQIGAALFTLRDVSTTIALDDFAESSAMPGRAFGMATLSPEEAERLRALATLAGSSLSILLLGESGTGKEVLAQGIHRMSGRAGPIVAVNCGALSATLVESLLFGHTKGAFSGALKDEPGFVLAADGGTLFLDEVGELPPAAQAALLRTIETKEVVAVGSTKPRAVDVRFVAATLRAETSLRPDLRARLSGHVHRLPPLRAVMENLGLLVGELLPRTQGGAGLQLSPEVVRRMYLYEWPMNVRELLQVLTSATLLASTDKAASVESRLLPPQVDAPAIAATSATTPSEQASVSRPRIAPDVRREELVKHLESTRGNISEVARRMATTRMQVHRWIEKFALDLGAYRKDGA